MKAAQLLLAGLAALIPTSYGAVCNEGISVQAFKNGQVAFALGPDFPSFQALIPKQTQECPNCYTISVEVTIPLMNGVAQQLGMESAQKAIEAFSGAELPIDLNQLDSLHATMEGCDEGGPVGPAWMISVMEKPMQIPDKPVIVTPVKTDGNCYIELFSGVPGTELEGMLAMFDFSKDPKLTLCKKE